jgi:hypothetical protein
LVKRWDKCISMLAEDMSRYKYYFQVWILHVLRFISICVLFTSSYSHVSAEVPVPRPLAPSAVITSIRPFRLFKTAPGLDFRLLTRLSNCIESFMSDLAAWIKGMV